MANAFIDGLYTTSAKVFLMKTGQVKDLTNENNFHPNANVNGLFVHIEDGVSTNIVTINFAPSKKPNWATHDFPLLYIDTIEHTIIGELTPRTFARYFNYMPSQLLSMNLNSSSIMDVGVTVKQQSGANLLGAFNTLADLQSEYNDQEVLMGFDEDNTIAYVYEVNSNGYYMVDYVGGTYQWVLKTNAYATYLSTKPYNMFTIKVQRGYQNTKPITPLEDEQYRLLWAYMGSFAGLIEAIGNRVTTLEEEMDLAQADIIDLQDQIDKVVDGTTDIAFDKTGTNLNSDFVEEAIKEVNDKSDANAQNIADMKDGTTIVKKAEQDKNGNTIDLTYATKTENNQKADKTYVDAQDQAFFDIVVEALASKEVVANKATNLAVSDDTKYPTTKAVKTYVDTTFVPKTRTILGLDLQDDILLTEFKTALGNATQSVAGLLSAEDKTHLDGLVALLESSDGDTIVDTIGEILAIFQNYPEGADLVTVLQGKVDKVAGKGLSTNDFTDALKNKLDGLLNGSQYYDKNYIDALKDQNGWESELLTLTPLAPSGTIATATLLLYNSLRLQVKNTSTSFVDTDTVEVSLGVVTGNKIQLSDTSVYLEIGATNSTFVAPAGWTLQIVGLKYTDLVASDVATDEVGVSVQDKLDKLDDLDSCFKMLNIYNKDSKSIVNGKFTAPTGAITNNAAWCYLDISVIGGKNISSYGARCMTCFYSESGEVVSGGRDGSNYVLAIPANATRMRVSTLIADKSALRICYSDVLEEEYKPYNLRLPNDNLLVYSKNETDELINGFVIEVGSGKQFESVIDAFRYAEAITDKKVIINIYTGDYNIYNELGGDSFVSGISPTATWKSGIQPVFKGDVEIYGKGNVTLRLEIPDAIKASYDYQSTRLSIINNMGNILVDNITFSAKNCRYGIHDECDGSSVYAYTKHTFRNCYFVIDNCPAGIGIGTSASNYSIENCYIRNNSYRCVYLHNWSTTIGGKLIISDSILTNTNGNGLSLGVNGTPLHDVSLSNTFLQTLVISSEDALTYNENCYRITAKNINLADTDITFHSSIITIRFEPVVRNW